jgi:hypothetical protein
METDGHHNDARETPDVSGVSNTDVAHEVSDVSVKGVSWFGLALFLLIALVCALMWWMFGRFERREKAAEPPPASRVAETEPRLAPEPRLQGVRGFHETLPQVDMKNLRESQDAVLASYGWVDQQAGVARIPIDRAKELLLQKGLPSRQESQPAARKADAALMDGAVSAPKKGSTSK